MALSTLRLRSLRNSELTAVLGGVPSTVLSIQGNCTDPPSEALLSRAGLLPGSRDPGLPLRPLKPRQCLLLTDSSTLYARQGRLWLDNLYIRLRTTDRTRSADFDPALVSVTDAPKGQLYMTNVTLQGSALSPSTGLYVTSATYAGDSDFVDLGVSMAPVRVLVQGAAASFEGCAFINNTVASTSAGVITTSVHAVALRLAGCTFDNSGSAAATPRAVVDANGSALIFSDTGEGVWLTQEAARSAGVQGANRSGVLTAAQPLSAVPRNVTFLAAADPWLVSVQAAVQQAQRVQVVRSGKPAGLGTSVVAIIVVVLLVPLVGLAIALVLWARRRTRMTAANSSDAALKPNETPEFSFHTSQAGSTPPAGYPQVQPFATTGRR